MRYPRGTRPPHVHLLHPLSRQWLRGSLRSPPPAPPARDIPPVPSLPTQSEQLQNEHGPGRRSPPNVLLFPPTSPGTGPPANDGADSTFRVSPQPALESPRHTISRGAGGPNPEPFLSSTALDGQYRPRSRRGTITNERPTASPSAIDDLPPLRRMGHRSINDDRPPAPPTLTSSNRHGLRPSDRHRLDDLLVSGSAAEGLGDRDRSISPDAEQWETLLTTITPDPSLPSAQTSFNSATESFPPPAAQPDSQRPQQSHSRVRRPVEAPLSPLSQPPSATVNNPAAPDDEACDTDSMLSPGDDFMQTLSDASPQSPSATDPALRELDQTIAELSARFHQLTRSFNSLADSFRVPDGASSSDRPDQAEVRALAADIRAVLDSLECTVRQRTLARAQRVSRGADPLAGIRSWGEARVTNTRDRSRSRSPTRTREEHPRVSRHHPRRSLRFRDTVVSGDPNRPESYIRPIDVINNRDGIRNRLRSRERSVRHAALESLPPDTRSIVLNMFHYWFDDDVRIPRRSNLARIERDSRLRDIDGNIIHPHANLSLTQPVTGRLDVQTRAALQQEVDRDILDEEQDVEQAVEDMRERATARARVRELYPELVEQQHALETMQDELTAAREYVRSNERSEQSEREH